MYNSLMYSIKFIDIINFDDKDANISKESRLVKLDLHKAVSEILFVRLSSLQMERKWVGLENYEYDVDRTAFLNRLTSGVAKVLQKENPVELDLRENVSSSNVLSVGRCLIYEKERVYKSFRAKILDVKKRNTANSILITQYWQRQFPTDRETVIKFQATDNAKKCI